MRFGGFGVGSFGFDCGGLIGVAMLWAVVNNVVGTGGVLDMFGVVLIYLDFTLVFLYGLVGLLGWYLFAVVVWLLRFCCLLCVFACVWWADWIVCCD